MTFTDLGIHLHISKSTTNAQALYCHRPATAGGARGGLGRQRLQGHGARGQGRAGAPVRGLTAGSQRTCWEPAAHDTEYLIEIKNLPKTVYHSSLMT